jgi:hypothetical protein
MNFKSCTAPLVVMAVGILSTDLYAGPNFQASTLLFENSFIGGRGSYQGATLLGEAMLGNSGSATELAWVESLISGSFPELPASFFETGGEVLGAAEKTYSVGVPVSGSYGYYMAKWGAGQNSTDHALWLITADDVLQYQLPNELSHSAIWIHPIPTASEATNVPEVVSTLALLGGATLLMVKLRSRARD